MIHRFEGEAGRRLRIDALRSQKIISGNEVLAEALADCIQLRAVPCGEVLIEQGGSDNEVYFILAGVMRIVVNGRIVGTRFANDTVGEMAAIEPTQKRSASVIASEDSVVACLTE